MILCKDPDDGIIRGACIYERDRMYIHTFYINARLRGKGFGSTMMRELMSIQKGWTVAIADKYVTESSWFWEKYRFEHRHLVSSRTKISAVWTQRR